MKKIIFRNFQSPGDIVMLTAAVRDLHQCHPNQFLTDVRTPFPELWEHNPYITPLDESDPDVEAMEAHYPLIHQCNELPYHFLFGFSDYFNQQLNLSIRPQSHRGDLYLSAEERALPSTAQEIAGLDRPYWIIAAGGKLDVTNKWWAINRYQGVVDHFADQIQFVQIGRLEHYHPALKNVVDLRGKTSLRDLLRLVYHTEGIISPVSLPMHLAAAVPTRPGAPAK